MMHVLVPKDLLGTGEEAVQPLPTHKCLRGICDHWFCCQTGVFEYSANENGSVDETAKDSLNLRTRTGVLKSGMKQLKSA